MKIRVICGTSTHTLEKVDSSIRLDECVAQGLHISRSQAQELIKQGCVQSNGIKSQKSGLKLTKDTILQITLPVQSPKPAALQIPPLEITRIYEDEELLILNKPPNLVIHSAPSVKEATLVDWLQAQGVMLSTLSGANRAGIVHRLDKQTSGAIAIAKTNATHAYLSQQLKDRAMGRYYLAFIDKPLKEPRMIVCNLARHPNNRLKMANIDAMGQRVSSARFSQSAFIPLINTQETSLLAIKLYTGRTHQIRAHLESINRHILGDRLYGYTGALECRVMLHAYLLYLTHPITRKQMVFRAEIFGDMLQCAQIFGAKEFDEAIRQDAIVQAFSQWDTACRAK